MLGEKMGGVWIPQNTGLAYFTLKCNKPGQHFDDECEYFDERSGMAIRHTGLLPKIVVNERGHVTET